MTKRRSLFLVGFVIIIALLFFLSQTLWSRHMEQVRAEEERIAQEEAQAAEQARQEAIRNKLISGNVSDENLKIVFLTFDDGPDSYTNQVLDILAANDVKATFFTNGRTDESWYDEYRRIVNEGHVLANHTFSHEYSIYNDTETFLADVQKLTDLQREVTGVEPVKIFRFPGGSPNANQECVDAIVNQGYGYFDWNVQFYDGVSDKVTADQAFQQIIDGVHGQSVSVVLAHAERPTKAGGRDALDAVIKQLKSEGYTFMTLDPAYQIARFTQPTGSTAPIIPDPGLS